MSSAQPPRSVSGPHLGYGTNGFAGHRLEDVLTVLADLGYQGVALTLDHCHLDPFAPGLERRAATLARRLDRLGLAVVVETGARYLLDPRRKHAPTLLDSEQEARRRYLDLAMRVGADLGAQAVSLWSGIRPASLAPHAAWNRLTAGCAWAVERAELHGVVLGFEPEPGMLVDTLDAYDILSHRLGDPPRFGLTLDIGHCRCLEPAPVPDCVRRAGEIDFPPVLGALDQAGYRGLISVELPRHSHDAPKVAARSLAFLQKAAAASAALTGAPDSEGAVR